MKIKPYVEKLEQSEEYKNFKIKYPEAYMIAGFFILDLETNLNVHQIDFYVPTEKKVAAFSLDGDIKLQLLDMVKKDGKAPEKLDIETNVDLDALQGILTDEMHNRGISEEIKKIIAVIQNIDGKKIWVLNCILTGMEIINSHIEDSSKTVLKLKKSTVLDIMKHLPKQVMKDPESKEDVEKEMHDLDKLQAEIEKEKSKLKEQLEKTKTEKK